jgi:hypothetical protein
VIFSDQDAGIFTGYSQFSQQKKRVIFVIIGTFAWEREKRAGGGGTHP